jgi:hypothetical protein
MVLERGKTALDSSTYISQVHAIYILYFIIFLWLSKANTYRLLPN